MHDRTNLSTSPDSTPTAFSSSIADAGTGAGREGGGREGFSTVGGASPFSSSWCLLLLCEGGDAKGWKALPSLCLTGLRRKRLTW